MNPHLVELNLALPDRIHTTDWFHSLLRVKQLAETSPPASFPFHSIIANKNPNMTYCFPFTSSEVRAADRERKLSVMLGLGLECEMEFVWCECRED